MLSTGSDLCTGMVLCKKKVSVWAVRLCGWGAGCSAIAHLIVIWLQTEVFAALSGTSCNIYTINTVKEEGKESSSIENTVSFQADFAEGEDGVVRARDVNNSWS